MIQRINTLRCQGCGRCIQNCPQKLFILEDKHVSIKEKEHCKSCGLCVSQCPWGAIALDDFDPYELSAKLTLSGNTPELLYLTCDLGNFSENIQGRVLQIPCLQAVGKFLLQEFLSIGFDGIAVNPCTNQKCEKYSKGMSTYIEQWQAYFSAQFLEPERIRVCKDFTEWLDFRRLVQELGPNPYRN